MGARGASAPATAEASPSARRLDPRQIIKVVVYALLLVNFVGYVAEDVKIASHTWHAGWGLINWTKTFATSLDETAWFVLLFLLELETYLLSDEAFTPGRIRLMHGLRLLCYVVIAHTVFAYADTVWDLSQAVEYAGVTACSFVDGNVSFARNLDYTTIDAGNCASLSSASTFYLFADGQALTDPAGMRVEWELAWVDVIESITWLCILLALEIMVRLQEKNVTEGPLMRTARVAKVLLYSVLWCAAAYWAWRGHWLFAWDESLWILGFVAIGMNLSDWRREIKGGQVAA